MRLCGFGQWKRASRRPGATSPRKNSSAACNSSARAHVRADQRQLPREQVPQIERGLIPGRCTAGHQAPAARQTPDAAIPRRRSDVFDDDVHAAVGRELAHARHDVVL